ncbi:hypothetical protein Cgig2_030936 [Carnegiea gigantea]|uniref:Uncharacterized protein n=1 Tax=Carnegiea gigantea TaxID=171969 RepID=A0A9Q1GHM5_9CARY|nr:hypothetical protein Cgig2_030936 [Carnegiea gigantea]
MEMNLFPNFANIEQALRKPSARGPGPLPPDYHGLYPCFDLGVATRYTYDSNIMEMVQIIFYVMGQPLLVREGVLKPSSEPAPLALHGLSPRIRSYSGDTVCSRRPYSEDGVGYLLCHGDQRRGGAKGREQGNQEKPDELRWDNIEAWLLSIKERLKDA